MLSHLADEEHPQVLCASQVMTVFVTATRGQLWSHCETTHPALGRVASLMCLKLGSVRPSSVL